MGCRTVLFIFTGRTRQGDIWIMDYEKRKRLIVNTAYGAVIFSLVYVAVQYGLKLIMPCLLYTSRCV